MINLRFKKAITGMLAFGGATAFLTGCAAKEDENASVVNVEKGVATPVSTPEANNTSMYEEQVAGLYVKATEDTVASQEPAPEPEDPQKEETAAE